MDEILHQLETMGNHCSLAFIGICRGFIIPGFFRWCEMNFVHPQYVQQLARVATNRPLPSSVASGGAAHAGATASAPRAGAWQGGMPCVWRLYFHRSHLLKTWVDEG